VKYKDNTPPIASLLKVELDKKCMEDLKVVMQLPEGRRLFSWIIAMSGFNNVFIGGNSKDFAALGRRSLGADLITAVNALGIEGMELRHKAEKEYLLYQMAVEEELKTKEKEER
jgi:hypothetical protein